MLTSLFCWPRNELYHWIENGLVFFFCMNVSVVDFCFLPWAEDDFVNQRISYGYRCFGHQKGRDGASGHLKTSQLVLLFLSMWVKSSQIMRCMNGILLYKRREMESTPILCYWMGIGVQKQTWKMKRHFAWMQPILAMLLDFWIIGGKSSPSIQILFLHHTEVYLWSVKCNSPSFLISSCLILLLSYLYFLSF